MTRRTTNLLWLWTLRAALALAALPVMLGYTLP